MKTKTTAEQAANIFKNNGRCYEAADGRNLDTVLRRDFGAMRTEGEGKNRDSIRYEFPDGSAIVDCLSAWDIEGSEPWSWAGAE